MRYFLQKLSGWIFSAPIIILAGISGIIWGGLHGIPLLVEPLEQPVLIESGFTDPELQKIQRSLNQADGISMLNYSPAEQTPDFKPRRDPFAPISTTESLLVKDGTVPTEESL